MDPCTEIMREIRTMAVQRETPEKNIILALYEDAQRENSCYFNMSFRMFISCFFFLNNILLFNLFFCVFL